jgi:hypothetical protein
MKKELAFIFLIGFVFSASISAQVNNDRYNKKQLKQISAYNCNRIQIDSVKATGIRIFRTPMDPNGTFHSLSIPSICFSKVIDPSGKEEYFLLFKIFCGKSIPWEKEVNSSVLFKDGHQIEKHSETFYALDPFNSYYTASMPLDSADLVLFRNSELKSIMLMNLEMTDFGLPEYFFYYLDCLVGKN